MLHCQLSCTLGCVTFVGPHCINSFSVERWSLVIANVRVVECYTLLSRGTQQSVSFILVTANTALRFLTPSVAPDQQPARWTVERDFRMIFVSASCMIPSRTTFSSALLLFLHLCGAGSPRSVCRSGSWSRSPSLCLRGRIKDQDAEQSVDVLCRR